VKPQQIDQLLHFCEQTKTQLQQLEGFDQIRQTLNSERSSHKQSNEDDETILGSMMGSFKKISKGLKTFVTEIVGTPSD
jgi:hypothetical protein